MSFCKLCFVFILIYSDVSSGQNNENKAVRFVQKSGKVCPRPEPTRTALLKTKYADKSKFNAGDVIEFKCKQGYFRKGGSRKRKCRKGKWTRLRLKCASTGSCVRPDPVANAVLKSEYRTKERFNDGESVGYDCAVGYTIAGRSRERKCNKGRWSEIRFTCNLITCPYVPPPEHGRRLDPNNGAGQTTEFGCNIGYELKGQRKLLCRTDGKWLPSRPPTCKPILCPELSRVRNGRLFQDTSDGIRNNYESVAEYTCNSVPRCERIPDFYGGDVTYFGDRKLYSQAFYRCADTFSLIPSDVGHSECDDTLRWIPDPPNCYKKAKKEVPANGYSRQGGNDILLHSESYRVCCYRSYEMKSGANYIDRDCERIVNNNGTLDPSVPECVEERCDPSEQYQANVKYENGTEVQEKFPSQTDVFLSCKNGYDYYRGDRPMQTPLKRTCVKGNIKYAPKCQEAWCLFSGYPNNEDTFHRVYRADARLVAEDQYIYPRKTIEVFCKKGYELYINSSKSYRRQEFTSECRFGQFSETKEKFPICLEKRCDPDDLSNAVVKDENGERIRTKIPSRTEVYLSCQNGYEYYSNGRPMNKPVIRECVKGTIINAPECEEQKCLFSGYPNNKDTHHRSDGRKVVVGQYIDHRKKVQVDCLKDKEEFELYVNSSQTYLDEFTTECRYGQFVKKREDFPICLEKRCSFDVSNDVCFSTDGNGACKPNTFKIHSGSKVQMRCKDEYKLRRSEGRRSVDVNGHTLLHCNKGNYPKVYKCIPDGVLKELEHRANELGEIAAEIIDQFTCRFSIFGFEPCEDPCLIPKIPFGFVTRNSDQVEYKADHGTTISVKCDSGYSLSEEMTTTCRYGEWENKQFPECVPKPCRLTLFDGISFRVDSRLLTGANGTTQIFDNGTKLQIACDKGYKMKDMNSKKIVTSIIRHSTCSLGSWTNRYKCIPDGCSVPTVSNARVQQEAARGYKHMEEITVVCKERFHFNQTITTKVTKFETTCNLGNWTDNIPQECKPDGCKLGIQKGSNYYLANTNESITTAGMMEHGTEIQLRCTEQFDLFNGKNEMFLDKNFMPTVACYRGKWINPYFCKERCAIYNITNGTFMKDAKNLTAGETVIHGESVTAECEDEDYGSNLSMECNNGEWQQEVDCSDPSSRYTTVKSTDSTTTANGDSTTENYEGSDDYEGLDESQSEDTLPAKNQSQNKRENGCKLPDDLRYSYEDSDGMERNPGSIISDGTTLTVTCTTIDLYEFYTDYYYGYDTESKSDPTIACADNTLSQFELDCPEVAADTCMELEHGNVKKENGYYMVSCDKGYSLNLIIPEKTQCQCVNGTLKSVYGNQVPRCKPDNCTVPHTLDGRLSVTDSNGVSLSGGSVVAIRDIVYFDCSKANEPNYEPKNRKFRCSNGLWIEAETNSNWKLGYNGSFPNCRKAICEPNCTNDGVCFKDDMCRCKHLTEGRLCENVICDNKCLINGGTCVGPGVCDCPHGKFGDNCEKEGCLLPKDAAKYKDSRTKFSPGETVTALYCDDNSYMLSSRDGMECRDDGSWSDIVKCIKAVVYLISVKTVAEWESIGEGTDAKVYITLQGLSGKTEKIYLVGSFEAGNLDETRVKAKDVRPITRVVIGHDGSGSYPNWLLDYVSIYVENMEEYYVFRHNDWVTDERDVLLPRQGLDQQTCIDSFDSGHKWYPKWGSIRRKDGYEIGRGGRMSLRGCKQACINLQNMQCVAVKYSNDDEKICHGFAVSDKRYFSESHGRWKSPVYLRTCK
ncbi:sushi, von Willebrand factor type A, EGF and pentraxin domain-containing protein 1-like isoform X2 [Mercenaria mercenaria]|uniref:sushi, von Willebrand factor type A, EGF and pentraxin domain-containing protein 1-like isoform X2 n=1 Tax=Mercenaria mercenaria TaxID=6596 RepID=UPI00234EB57A|nr:sushi, von Willebrand factor type A, EGF and pentraxin domain-containing protein 1-like isoform X2 [Mercenaria mercenaria]